MRVSFESDVLC